MRMAFQEEEHDHGVVEQVDDDDIQVNDKAHPKQVDDCRSVRAGKVKAEIQRIHF